AGAQAGPGPDPAAATAARSAPGADREIRPVRSRLVPAPLSRRGHGWRASDRALLLPGGRGGPLGRAALRYRLLPGALPRRARERPASARALPGGRQGRGPPDRAAGLGAVDPGRGGLRCPRVDATGAD